MHRFVNWRVIAVAFAVAGTAVSAVAQNAEQLAGVWQARQVRWRAPHPLTNGEQSDARRRPSETLLVDLQLELRQVDDTLWGRLSNLRDPEDIQWRRLLVGRSVGDSIFLAAAASPGQPNIEFEGVLEATRLRGRLNVPPRADLRPGVVLSPAAAIGRHALPPMPARDQWLPVQFWRAPE